MDGSRHSRESRRLHRGDQQAVRRARQPDSPREHRTLSFAGTKPALGVGELVDDPPPGPVALAAGDFGSHGAVDAVVGTARTPAATCTRPKKENHANATALGVT